jgi:hypothetical protein
MNNEKTQPITIPIKHIITPKNSPTRSPIRSPIKSPNKLKHPFFGLNYII